MKTQEYVFNLLWVDDDVELLEPLRWTLEYHGFMVRTVASYAEALVLLAGGEKFDGLLTDVIIPYGPDRGSLEPNLGLSLAEYAAARGVGAVAFLTVVPLSEVQEKYEAVKAKHPLVKLNYYNKLFLLEPFTIESLMESLKPRRS
ncbi:MAG TPA: response regulator [Pyrinomonadaceae bacterium]|nr:response regulator [Pyrinomonadaceae bacterium]